MKKITRLHLERFLARHASEERTLDIGSGGSSYQRFFPNRVTVDIDPALGDPYDASLRAQAAQKKVVRYSWEA